MSNNQVTFKVQGNDLLSFFDKAKQKGNELTNSLIANAEKEAKTAKEQIKLLQDQISLIEKKNRTAAQISALTNQGNLQARIQNAPQRDYIFDELHRRNNERYRNKELTKGEYLAREGRIDALINRNSPEAITKEYREFTKYQAQQLRETQLQTKFARENVLAVRESAKENVTALKRGDESISSLLSKATTKQEMLAANLAKETVQSENKKGEHGHLLEGITGTLLNLDNLRHLIGGFGQFTSTQNGFDLIKPSVSEGARVAGLAIGAALGSIIEPGGGSMVGAGIGGELGGALGGAAGEFLQRKALSIQEYQSSINRYSAITGADKSGLSVSDMTQFGLASKDFINLMRETAKINASSTGAEQLAKNRYFAERGYGVDQATSSGLIGLNRYGSSENIANLIGGVLQKGQQTYFKNDRTFLNEFLGKFTQLQRELLKTQNTVGTATTYDILSRFNSLGGQFRTTDPRSMGLISTINNALVNPQSDNMKAASFLALRQANPNMDVFDLLKEQQKGLGSPTYLSSLLKMVDRLGGDATQKKLNIANALGLGNNLAAAESIYKNEDALRKGTISLGSLGIPTDLSSAAKANTTPLEANMAKISDGLLKGWYETLSAMKDSWASAMQEVVDGVNVANEGGRLKFDYNPVKANAIRATRQKATKTSLYNPVGGVYDMIRANH